MRRRNPLLTTALLGLLVAFLTGIVVNVATETLPASWKRWAWLAWVAALPLIMLGARLQVWQQSLPSTQRTPGGRTTGELTPYERRLMLQRVQEQASEQLAKILGSTPPLELTLKERPDLASAATMPQERVIEQTPKRWGSNAIAKVFNDIGRALLVLGESGSGKTTLLTRLLLALVKDAEQDHTQPIPVVVNLASWRQGMLLEEWLAEQLNARYEVPTTLASSWIAADQIAVLLDGLDEVPVGQRDGCVAAIEAFRASRGLLLLAVGCRTDEYRKLDDPPKLYGAVEILLPARAEALAYLERLDPRATATVRGVPKDDRSWWDLVRTPLMLGIIASIVQHTPTAPLVRSGSRKQRRAHLMRVYVDAMFTRRLNRQPPPFSRQQTEGWLRWLATLMLRHGQSEFRVDRMARAWLPHNRNEIVVRAFMQGHLFAIVLLTAISLPLLGVRFALPLSLFGPMLLRDPLGRHLGDREQPLQLAERIVWSWRRALGWLALLPVIALYGVVVARSPELREGSILGLSGAALLTIGLLLVLLATISLGLEAQLRPEGDAPDDGMRRSARTAMLAGGAAGLLAGGSVAAAMVVFPDPGASGPLAGSLTSSHPLLTAALAGVIFALVAALTVGMETGGAALCGLWVLRSQLHRHGGPPPRRYVEFLEYATDRVLLRKVGNSYQFLHRFLLEHFASDDSQEAGSREALSRLPAS